MLSFQVIGVLILVFKHGVCVDEITEQENQMIPPMHGMDDYSVCKQEEGLYCRFHFKLSPDNSNNTVWRIIQRRKQPFAFNRDSYYRYRCLPRKLIGNNKEIIDFITNKENGQLKNISLSVEIAATDCNKFEGFSLTKDDVVFIAILLSLLIVVAMSTLYHIGMMYSEQKYEVNKYLICFSVKKNWDKLLELPAHPDYVRLKSFQGFKALSLCGVVGGHYLIGLVAISTTNPEFFESFYSLWIIRYLIHFGLHFVQIYFLLAAWLLSSSLFPMYFNGQKFKFSAFLQVIIIRYGRLIGPVALCVLLGRTTLYKLFERGAQAVHIRLNYESCTTNGWATLFLVNGYSDLGNQCHFIAWYVSVDFQLFLGTIILLQIVSRFGFSQKQFLQLISVIIGISWLYNAALIYIKRWPIMLMNTPEYNRLEIMFNNETLGLYSSIYTNIGGYCVGLFAGAYYNNLKSHKSSWNKWYGKCGFLSLFIIMLAMYDYSPFVNAIMGASLKPLFNFGITCYLMTTAFSDEKTILRKILESKYLEIIAKLSYSTYISHYWIAFGQELLFVNMFEMTYFRMFGIYFIELALSFLLGLILYILIESPIRQLLAAWVNGSTKKPLKSD